MEWLPWTVAMIILIVLGILVWQLRQERARHQHEAGDMRDRHESEVDALRGRHESELESLRLRHEEQMATVRSDLERREDRLHEKEDRLAAEASVLEARAERLDRRRELLAEEKQAVRSLRESADAELTRLAGLSHEAAHQEVVHQAEHRARLDAAAIARDIEDSARRDARRVAQSIISSAIQRCAAQQTADSVTTSVHLPSDDMKGRIIGREGRNIRAFEQITGVNLIIDDTPETVLLSSFDPVRREVARLTLADLVADGRIHPARIEEVFEHKERDLHDQMLHTAQEALAEVSITDLSPDLLPYIGALAYRTSYGQNVLRHLVESAHIAGVMAAELGMDVASVRRAAFLHDIGKALTHEHEGPHAIVGAELLRKHGEHEDIVHAVEAHHNEVEPTTAEALIVQAADAISGSRPGARRESVEAHVQRVRAMEDVALSHDGVDKVYAMQAGRDIRVMVAPEAVDDLAAQALARDIASEIESTLTYPGRVKVTVIRESRATATAQ